MTSRRSALLALSSFGLAAVAGGPAPRRVLRISADPNNLPFTNERREGFENKIAELLALEMDAGIRYAWRAQRRGFFREALKGGECDLVLAASAALVLASCRREDRPYRPSPATAQTVRWTRVSDLQPGPAEAADPKAARVVPGAAPDVYEENAFAFSEGKRLYAAFNCSGCHSPGGGGTSDLP